jgi:hypothetical protein
VVKFGVICIMRAGEKIVKYHFPESVLFAFPNGFCGARPEFSFLSSAHWRHFSTSATPRPMTANKHPNQLLDLLVLVNLRGNRVSLP